MLNIHLFGKYRQLAEKKGATDNSVVHLEYKKQETMRELLNRMNIDPDSIGELFVNHKVAELDTTIQQDESRIAIFPEGMHLLCGGQHLKGPGFIKNKEKASKQFEYW